MLTRDQMRPYQVELADMIVTDPALLLAVPMSLGKTCTVLTAIRKLFDRCEISKVLVVAPLRVARHVAR